MKRILGTTAIILSLTGPAFADAHAAGFGTVTAQETDFFASDLSTQVFLNPALCTYDISKWQGLGISQSQVSKPWVAVAEPSGAVSGGESQLVSLSRATSIPVRFIAENNCTDISSKSLS